MTTYADLFSLSESGGRKSEWCRSRPRLPTIDRRRTHLEEWIGLPVSHASEIKPLCCSPTLRKAFGLLCIHSVLSAVAARKSAHLLTDLGGLWRLVVCEHEMMDREKLIQISGYGACVLTVEIRNRHSHHSDVTSGLVR